MPTTQPFHDLILLQRTILLHRSALLLSFVLTMNSALWVSPQLEASQYTSLTLTLTLTLLQYHLQNLQLISHNSTSFEPVSQSQLENDFDSALSSSQPSISKLPLIQCSFHCEQIGIHSVLFISLPGQGYLHLTNNPERQLDTLLSWAQFLLEGVLFLFITIDLGKEKKN